MASVTKSAGAGASLSGGMVDRVWVKPGNILASDNSYATATFGSAAAMFSTRILRASNFGFEIPSDAVITGIKAEIELHRQFGTGTYYGKFQDESILLYKADNAYGEDRRKYASLPGTDAYWEYGGNSDLWGGEWSPDDINYSGFGLGFIVMGSGLDNADSNVSYVYVDHVQITVYYTEDVTIEAATCEASQTGVVPIIRERLTAGAAQATLATGEHSISHVALSPSAGVNASGVTLALLNVLRTETGGLSASCPDAKLLWAVRATTAGLVAEVLDPMFVAGDWIIYATSCGLTCAVQAPTIKEIMKGVAPAGIAVDAVLPSACFSVPSGSCSISLDAADPALRQVLHAVVTEMVARADAPKILLRVPVDTCRLAASLVAPSAGYRVATETAEMPVSLFPPRILEAIRAVTAETVLEGIPARTVYDMLIRAMAAGISCTGVEPRVYCAGWDRIEQDSSVWTRIDREPSVWTRIK